MVSRLGGTAGRGLHARFTGRFIPRWNRNARRRGDADVLRGARQGSGRRRSASAPLISTVGMMRGSELCRADHPHIRNKLLRRDRSKNGPLSIIGVKKIALLDNCSRLE